MRTLINIIILILLSLSLYVIPLNTQVFDFEGESSTKEDGSETADTVKYECIFTKNNDDKFLLNPKSYELKVDSSLTLPENLEERVQFDIQFEDSKGKIIKLDKKDFEDIIVDKNPKNFTLKLKFSDVMDKLNYSNYKVTLSLDCLDNEFEDEFEAFLQKEDITLQNNALDLYAYLEPCFYSDKSLKYSIPVYREKVNVSNVFSNLMFALASKPEEVEKAGLEPFRIDMDTYIPRVWYQNGGLTCKFYEENFINIKNEAQAESTFRNLLNSFAIFSSKYIINELDIQLLNSEKNEIAGFKIDKVLKVNRSPKLYLPIFLNDNDKKKYFWLPFDFEEGENLKSDIVHMLEIFKTAPEYTKENKLIALIPNIKVYKDINLVEDKLIIELSEEMYEYLNGNAVYTTMIKEAFSLSFSSIDGIKSYELWYENKLVEEIGGVKFGESILAPNSFNRIN